MRFLFHWRKKLRCTQKFSTFWFYFAHFDHDLNHFRLRPVVEQLKLPIFIDVSIKTNGASKKFRNETLAKRTRWSKVKECGIFGGNAHILRAAIVYSVCVCVCISYKQTIFVTWIPFFGWYYYDVWNTLANDVQLHLFVYIFFNFE